MAQSLEKNDTSETALGGLSKHRRLVIVTLLVLLCLGGLLGAGPLYRQIKLLRANRFLRQAQELAANNQIADAKRKAQAALMLARREPGPLRLLAQLHSQTASPVALQLWRELLLTGRATREERQTFVELALRSGAYHLADAELNQLLPSDWKDPRSLWLAAQLGIVQRDYNRTLHFAALAEEFAPTNKQYRLFAASLWLQSPEPAQPSGARKTLFEIAADQSPLGLEAISFLAREAEPNAEEMRQLIALLEQHPLAGIDEKLLQLNLRIRLQPDQRGPMLETAIANFSKTDDKDLARFGAWLNRQAEYEFALRALPFERCAKSAELTILRLDALAGLERWKEILDALERSVTALSAVQLNAYRSRAARQLRDDTMASVHWRGALRAAEGNPSDLALLADYANRAEAWDDARQAFKALVTVAPDSGNAHFAYSAFLQKCGTTVELRDFIQHMARKWPENSSLRNDVAYLNLLLGEEIEASVKIAEELVQKSSAALPQRTTLALGRYRLKDFAGALAVYEGHEYDWHRALPGNYAVYIAVLAANGKTIEAREHLSKLNRALLRPEELDLVQPGN